MAIYVGLDVSLEDTHYCIHDHTGKRLAEGKVVTDPDEIQNVLEPYRNELDLRLHRLVDGWQQS